MSSDGPAQSSLRRPFFVANQAVFSGCWKFSPGFPQNSKTFPPSAPTCPRNGVFRALRGRLRTGLLQSSTATEAGLGARGSPERKASTSGLARPGHDRSAKEAGPQGPVSGPGSGCTDPQGPVRTRTHPNRRDRTSRKGGDQEAPITARPSGGALAPASKPGCAEGDDLRVPAGKQHGRPPPSPSGSGTGGWCFRGPPHRPATPSPFSPSSRYRPDLSLRGLSRMRLPFRPGECASAIIDEAQATP